MSDIPTALTIAGSDSGGAAGIQADLKTFTFHRVHGTSAITCVTAQNTLGVSRVDPLSPEAVIAQIEAVCSDMKVFSLKTGMLLNQAIIEGVAATLEKWQLPNLVVDPVMVSRTGAVLIDDQAITTLYRKLCPHALMITPNRYEAQILSDQEIHNIEQMKTAAKSIYEQTGCLVLLKGGGMKGSLKGVDLWFDGTVFELISTKVVDTKNTHGTGCTLSAAITANLALGYQPFDAVVEAKNYLTQALVNSLNIGKGNGPVGHFFSLLA